MPKKFYSETLAVPDKQIAGKNPIPGAPAVGAYKPQSVPETPGKAHGTGTLPKAFGPGHVKGAHGFGHPPHAHKGHLRMSGTPGAHRLGASGIRKTPSVNRP